MILIEHCHVEYSFHAYSYKGRIPGPNVVYQSDCVAKNGDVGPHMKWCKYKKLLAFYLLLILRQLMSVASGQLYDSKY